MVEVWPEERPSDTSVLTIMSMPILRIIFAALFLITSVSAQFQFFDSMFGGQQQRQQERPSGASQWQMHSESSTSSGSPVP